jgi:hypothetical protein
MMLRKSVSATSCSRRVYSRAVTRRRVSMYPVNYFSDTQSFVLLSTFPTFQVPSPQRTPHPLLQTVFTTTTWSRPRAAVSGLPRTYSLRKRILNGELQIASLRRLRPPAQRRHAHRALPRQSQQQQRLDAGGLTFINCAEQNDASPPQCACMHLHVAPNDERFHMASQTNSAGARTGKKFRRSRHLKPRRGTLPTADSALFPRELGRYMRVQETTRLMQLRLLIWKQQQRQQRPVCAYEQNERLQLEAQEGEMHAHSPLHATHTTGTLACAERRRCALSSLPLFHAARSASLSSDDAAAA